MAIFHPGELTTNVSARYHSCWGPTRGGERWPFPLAIAIFALSFLNLGLSLYPYVVPFGLTIWDAAASRDSQEFLLVGVAVMLPIVLLYTGYNYWVFRGKVNKTMAYH